MSLKWSRYRVLSWASRRIAHSHRVSGPTANEKRSETGNELWLKDVGLWTVSTHAVFVPAPGEETPPWKGEGSGGSVELTEQRRVCSTVPCKLKLAAWRQKARCKTQPPHPTKQKPPESTNTHTEPLCTSQLVSLLVGVVRSASPRRHVPWQHSYLIGSIAMATEASLLSQG